MRRRVFVFTLMGMFLFVLCAVGDSDSKSRPRDPKENIGRTYSIILQLPPAQRKALFRALPPAAKSAVWIAHLDNFLRSHPELDSNQRAIVGAAIAIVGALYESGSTQGNVSETASQLETAARLSFPPELLHQAFYDLGPTDTSSVIAFDSTLRVGTPMAADTDPVVLDDCTCNHEHDWCGSGQCALSGCKPVSVGCGFLMMSGCDGHCE